MIIIWPSLAGLIQANFLMMPQIVQLVLRLGAVFKPEDALKRKEMIREALRDLSPSIRETVERLMEGHSGVELEEKLRNLIGIKRTLELLGMNK